jgi:hypothetical protein
MGEKKEITKEVDAVRHIMATIYSAQNALRDLAPEYKWAGMGNLLGDYGEFIACHYYDLIKAPSGHDGSDAITPDGKTVQVKTNHAAVNIGFRGEADKMLVLKVDDDGNWEEVYFGDFTTIKNLARYSKRDNKYMIEIKKLKEIAKNNK